MSTPNYGFPYPTLSDTPSVPRDLEALAEAVDAALAAVQAAGAAPYAFGRRATDSQFASGAMTSLGMSAAIGTATAGVYLVTYMITLSSTAVSAGFLRVKVNGVDLTNDHRADLGSTSRTNFSGAIPYVLTVDGPLTVTADAQIATGTATVWANSYLSATRVGSAAA